ncbi:MAG: hypothetical protein JO362_02360 [Streptomycetaceae bacterium]|nr:hypothetical protein [Streptomycetaceae bacterium]
MTLATEQRSSPIQQRLLLLQHLDQTADFTDTPDSAEPGIPVPVGLAGAALAGDSSVLVVGQRRAAGKPRHLSEILPKDRQAAILGEDLLRAAVDAGTDPVLYHAWRDILPPRWKHAEGNDALAERDTTGRETAFWYADLVVYRHGILPDRQPFRSTGHFNAAEQLEVFQTLTGRVAMLIAGTSPNGVPYLSFEICEPGAITVVPPGAWHVTYCLDGPAAVFNIYTDRKPTTPAHHSSRQGALDPALKYHRAAGHKATIRVDDDGGIRLDAEEGPLPTPKFTTAAWLDAVVPTGTDLVSLYLHPSAMDTLLEAAEAALATGWPQVPADGHTQTSDGM